MVGISVMRIAHVTSIWPRAFKDGWKFILVSLIIIPDSGTYCGYCTFLIVHITTSFGRDDVVRVVHVLV